MSSRPDDETPSRTASLAPGTRLGPYEILGPLGAGGMGEVFRARDTRLGREVAVKRLRPELAASEDRRKRFEREARAASALNHPHIVSVFDIGDEAGSQEPGPDVTMRNERTMPGTPWMSFRGAERPPRPR
jgi:serine/threonine protein kinase